MIAKTLLMGSFLTALTITMPSLAAESSSLSDAQKKDLEKVIHDYLVNNPEVLLEASQVLQQKQQQTMQAQAEMAIKENAHQLFNDGLTLLGNPKGNVTLVEFFDYQCIHCKKMMPTINALIEKNKNLRVIYKEFPIFGKGSDTAARVALAAAMQGKYQVFHDALMKQSKRLNDELVMQVAQSVNLNMAKLKTDMNSKTVSDALEANRKLAEKLHLMGTPALIIAQTPAGQFNRQSSPTFIPGAASQETLEELIQKNNGA